MPGRRRAEPQVPLDRRAPIGCQLAVWRHPGMPVVPLRWVLVRDPKDEFRPLALLCTDAGVTP
jgi:hypothetical protein